MRSWDSSSRGNGGVSPRWHNEPLPRPRPARTTQRASIGARDSRVPVPPPFPLRWRPLPLAKRGMKVGHLPDLRWFRIARPYRPFGGKGPRVHARLRPGAACRPRRGGTINAPGDDLVAVEGEDQAPHGTRMAPQGKDLATRGSIPELDRPVVAGRGQRRPSGLNPRQTMSLVWPTRVNSSRELLASRICTTLPP